MWRRFKFWLFRKLFPDQQIVTQKEFTDAVEQRREAQKMSGAILKGKPDSQRAREEAAKENDITLNQFIGK